MGLFDYGISRNGSPRRGFYGAIGCILVGRNGLLVLRKAPYQGAKKPILMPETGHFGV